MPVSLDLNGAPTQSSGNERMASPIWVSVRITIAWAYAACFFGQTALFSAFENTGAVSGFGCSAYAERKTRHSPTQSILQHIINRQAHRGTAVCLFLLTKNQPNYIVIGGEPHFYLGLCRLHGHG